MKQLRCCSILLVLFCLASFAFDQAGAQNKVVKKTIHKVITAPVAPVEAPKNVPSKEVLAVPAPPPPPATYEIEYKEASKGLFGWGLNADLGALYLLNSRGQTGLLGVLGGRADIIFSDPLKLGAKIGLAEDALEYKAGLGLIYGNDTSNNSIKSLPLLADATLYLKEGSFFGLDPYVSAGLNLNLFGSGSQSGGLGWQFSGGVLVDFGLGNKTAISLGFNSFRVSNLRLAEGLALTISQPLRL